ncbi:hypothetical protein C4K05_2400 [Pseudomonas chlororaphis subsp. aureofaciens]|uniref:Uncharacterized protein n=1 Tax=Pseudomonas chlororaphis subsp. aureofaciens TaxID=587851 RepID=A0AAD0ZHS5_9PSED|nr:hypothetical protein [Pseudomonas chlororaphis]AZE22798.1 hypothetical protein C4K08_2371 [Pseudomonas chlororaphis subsp. aureofaciens]AZE29082.1 hypothetical protein C4K07_2297 [Pseudomonas chlororaphis subsp. aureofaciens]AZE35384.1 hypothetical protein C4K06_2351 [Pseudomonas chlororaphis subsp. aureofaciens]AZE41740.1 hypothetical protein C4K05_2400 [Pseudomonas chlororaphis subsp. aureofaciens]
MKIKVPQSVSDCIFLGAAAGTKGGTTDTRRSVGHLKLTYAAQKIFGIHRLPTHPERFTDTTTNDYKVLAEGLEAVTATDWVELIRDLKSVYTAIQKQLAVDYPAGFVPLQRRLRVCDTLLDGGGSNTYEGKKHTYGIHLAFMVLKAQSEGRADLDFDTDILTGWCLKDPGSYGEILIRRQVPIADILLSANYIDASSGIEVDEWLILNREPNGALKVDPTAVEIPTELFVSLSERASRTEWDSLQNYRFEISRNYVKMPFFYFGSATGKEYPWIIRSAFKLARWWCERKSRCA